MYRLVIFLACLAVGYGKGNSSTSVIINPTSTVSISNKTTSMPTVTTYAMSSYAVLNSSMVMSTSMPTPTPVSTPTPKSTVATTTPKPVTTSPPKPTMPPHGDFSIMKDGKYCLLAQLDVLFNVTYYQKKKEGNKTNDVEAVASIPLPKEGASTNGSECGKVNATLIVFWPKKNPLYKFTMKFVNNASTGWMVDAVTFDALTKDNKTFTNASVPSLTLTTKNESNLQYLSAHINGSYMCGIDKDYPFSNNSGVMIINYARLQPFGVQNKKKGQEEFGEENNCQPKKKKKEETSSNIVPIAVGCALAGLVLIVLIAYIIGRRKSQRGYEKV